MTRIEYFLGYDECRPMFALLMADCRVKCKPDYVASLWYIRFHHISLPTGFILIHAWISGSETGRTFFKSCFKVLLSLFCGVNMRDPFSTRTSSSVLSFTSANSIILRGKRTPNEFPHADTFTFVMVDIYTEVYTTTSPRQGLPLLTGAPARNRTSIANSASSHFIH